MKFLLYLIRRLLWLIPVVLIVTFIVFVISRVLPGNPVYLRVGARDASPEVIARLTHEMGLDKPILVQYGIYLNELLHGNWGTAWHTNNPVTKDILARFPATLELAAIALLLSILVGIPLGVVSAVHKDSVFDHTVRIFSLTGLSVPEFWLGLVAILFFCFEFKILPPPMGRLANDVAPPSHITGLYLIDALLTGNGKALVSGLQHILLPAATLALGQIAGIARMVRNTMVEVLNSDYIRAARANGIADNMIYYADFGLIVMSALGYLDMCGHALIGAVTTLLEVGILSAKEPITKLTVETPAGYIQVRASVFQGKVQSVTFRNQPAFVYKRDLEGEVETLGRLTVDIAYGGLWYVIVEAGRIGLEIRLENLDKLSQARKLLLKAVNASISVKHPQRELAEDIPQLLFIGPPVHPEANGRNLVTSAELGFDRSPCGTGSCAKMALLYAKGDLDLNEDYVHESIIDTLLCGRLVKKTRIESVDAVIPEITGNAYVTGINYILIDPRDPLRHGFYACGSQSGQVSRIR